MSTLGAHCESPLGGFLESTLGARTCADPCSCACGLASSPLGTAYNGTATPGSFGGAITKFRSDAAIDFGGSAWKTLRCSRLFVWNCAYHDGTKYVLNHNCLTIIRTEYAGRQDAYDGPFCDDRKCSLSSAGASLTDEPYWWSSVGGSGIGGWAIIGSWWRPDADPGLSRRVVTSELEEFYNILLADIGAGSMPGVGEKHTLIAYMSFMRDEAKGGPATDDNTSSVWCIAVHATCPS